MKKIILLALSLLLSTIALAQSNNIPDITIQRLSVLGFNESGDEGAFLLSHFGPSSKAPFVRLLVFKSGNIQPVFEDGSYLFSGGENELAMLAEQLVSKNSSQLEAMGINLKTPLYDTAHYIVEDFTDGASGWIDIENVGLTRFSVKSSPSPYCNSSQGIQLKVCAGTSCTDIQPQKTEDCGVESAQLKTMYRTRNSLWFIIAQKIQMMPGLEAYFLSPVGVRF